VRRHHSSFQSTHPRRVRRLTYAPRVSPGRFQSTHPRRVRPLWICVCTICGTFQSTHPRRVRQGEAGVHGGPHAFQSTHPRRVRPRCEAPVLRCMSRFQSTHPRRVRRLGPDLRGLQQGVSIHAPAQGATPDRMDLQQRIVGFNPRTRAGCDSISVLTPVLSALFQSTHPRRVRPWRRRGPHGPVGVSIHAPAQGATWAPQGFGSVTTMFQSTHPRRVRRVPGY